MYLNLHFFVVGIYFKNWPLSEFGLLRHHRTYEINKARGCYLQVYKRKKINMS